MRIGLRRVDFLGGMEYDIFGFWRFYRMLRQAVRLGRVYAA